MILVPTEISQFALSKGKELPIHCYLLLKQETPGYAYLNIREIRSLTTYLKRSERQVRRYFRYLEKIGWVEPMGKVFTIKSWRRVFELMGFRYVSGVEVDPTKIDDPRAFFAGVVLGRLVNYQSYKHREGRSDGKSAISLVCASTKLGLPTHFPVSDRALASILGISPSKANRLKKLAHTYGYIDLKYNYSPFELNGRQVQIDRSYWLQFRETFEDIAHKLRIDHRGLVSVQEADLIKSNLLFKASRNYL